MLKARYGKGGLLDFLRAAQAVAPSILPDLVTLDVSELRAAEASGVLQPLDAMLDADAVARLYDFARAARLSNGRLLAVQYVADIDHLVYLPDLVPVPPATWDDLIDAQVPYLFAAAGVQPGVNTSPAETAQRAVVNQYLSAFDRRSLTETSPALVPDALLRLLQFYQQARDVGVIADSVTELSDADAVWSVFAQGQTPMALVSARRYLRERDTLKLSGFAGAPGWSAPVVPVAHGWALAVVTTDPARQRAAASFIAWLLDPPNAGAWARAAGWLPTSPEAMDIWGDNPYFNFLDEQLTDALSYPAAGDSQTVATLQRAATSVLNREQTPAEAVRAVAAP